MKSIFPMQNLITYSVFVFDHSYCWKTQPCLCLSLGENMQLLKQEKYCRCHKPKYTFVIKHLEKCLSPTLQHLTSFPHFLVAKGTFCESECGFVWYRLARVHISLSCTRTTQAEMFNSWKTSLMNSSFDKSIRKIHETASLALWIKLTQ